MAYTGVAIDVEGAKELVSRLNKLEGEFKKRANGDLRRASKDIALGVVDRKHTYLGGSGAGPVGAAVVDGVRVKYDRFVAVQVPGVKPKVSGMKKHNAARAKSISVAIEWGSNWPGLGNPPKGVLVGRNMARLSRDVFPMWQAALGRVLADYGLI